MKTETPRRIVFTDIDGTILNEAKSYQESKPPLEKIKALDVLLFFCSSKTQAEIEFYAKELGIGNPFIVENGGAIFIPKGYFSFSIPQAKNTRTYDVVELGLPYSVVREKLAKASAVAGAVIVGFGDMTVPEVAASTGLTLPLARLAKRRRFDEPFRLVQGSKDELAKAVAAEGLTLTFGGKYSHVLGKSDKGKAVGVLKELLVRKFGDIVTYGVGDSENDLSMLAAVDKPMLVRKELGGRNAHLVAWTNLLRLLAEDTE